MYLHLLFPDCNPRKYLVVAIEIVQLVNNVVIYYITSTNDDSLLAIFSSKNVLNIKT